MKLRPILFLRKTKILTPRKRIENWPHRMALLGMVTLFNQRRPTVMKSLSRMFMDLNLQIPKKKSQRVIVKVLG